MNILNLIQEHLTPQVLNQAGAAVGESTEATKSAFGMALPALLGKLVSDASSGKGATEIFGLLNQAKPQQGWPDTGGALLSSFTGSGGTSGNSLVSSLLGSKASGVADFIANRSGIKTSSAMSILSMAGPLLMGVISKLVSGQGLGATGLGQLLRSQASHLSGVLPSGLANTLGIGDILSGATDAAKSAASTVQTASAGLTDSVRAGATHAAGAMSSGRGILRWAWIPVLLLLGGLLAFQQFRKNQPAAGGSGDQTYSAPQTSQLNLAGLQSLTLTPGSVADRMAKAVTSGEFTKPLQFPKTDLDASGELSEAAQGNLAEVAAVIRAVPGLTVTATGYGQTTEEGLARANEIKSILVAKGAPASRVAVKGMAGTGSPQFSLSR